MKLEKAIPNVKTFTAFDRCVCYTDTNRSVFLNDQPLYIQSEYTGTYFEKYGWLICYDQKMKQSILVDAETLAQEHVDKERLPHSAHFHYQDRYLVNDFRVEGGGLKNRYYWYWLNESRYGSEFAAGGSYYPCYKNGNNLVFLSMDDGVCCLNDATNLVAWYVPKQVSAVDGTAKGDERVNGFINGFVGATKDVAVFNTSNDWLVGLDTKTGQGRWVLKQIGELEISGLITFDSIWCASHYKIDANGFLYAYRNNIYTEIDTATGAVRKIINQFKGLPDYGFNDPHLQADFPPVVKDGEVLCFIGTHREPIKEENRPGANLRIVALNTSDGSVVDEFEFSKKDGKAIGGFRDVQYADGKLYCLGGRNNTLYVIRLT